MAGLVQEVCRRNCVEVVLDIGAGLVSSPLSETTRVHCFQMCGRGVGVAVIKTCLELCIVLAGHASLNTVACQNV